MLMSNSRKPDYQHSSSLLTMVLKPDKNDTIYALQPTQLSYGTLGKGKDVRG